MAWSLTGNIRGPAASSAIPTNSQSGTSYTAVATDAGKRIVMTNSAANSAILDASLYSIGEGGVVQQGGTGTTTLTPASGTTFFPSTGASTTAQGQLLYWIVDSSSQISVGP